MVSIYYLADTDEIEIPLILIQILKKYFSEYVLLENCFRKSKLTL